MDYGLFPQDYDEKKPNSSVAKIVHTMAATKEMTSEWPSLVGQLALYWNDELRVFTAQLFWVRNGLTPRAVWTVVSQWHGQADEG